MPRVPPVTAATRAMPSPRSSVFFVASASALDAHGDAHAAADAERGQALLRAALLHLVEQGHQHARTRRADRMAERDGAAIDVDLGRIPAEILVDRAGLRGEGLVRLDQVEVLDLPAGLGERCPAGRDR